MMLAELTIKYNWMGYSIYSAMGLYTVALLAWLVAAYLQRSARLAIEPKETPLESSTLGVLLTRGLSWVLFAAGFGVAAVGWACRWIEVEHPPMQLLFEVFWMMGLLMFPISLFSRYVLRVGGQWADMLLGICILFPAGLVFEMYEKPLVPALQTPLFVPHIAVYLAGYVIMAKAGILAIETLIVGPAVANSSLVSRDKAFDRLIRMGFPLITVGMLMGALWAQQAFGDWWGFDSKETWSLIAWLWFVVYFHLRATRVKRRPRVLATVVLLAVLSIGVTLMWTNIRSNLLEWGWADSYNSYHLYSTSK